MVLLLNLISSADFKISALDIFIADKMKLFRTVFLLVYCKEQMNSAGLPHWTLTNNCFKSLILCVFKPLNLEITIIYVLCRWHVRLL